ncbi:MAG: FAD-dependent oxidoreductase, partial [Clostridia bacterium]|nr:FAD-dependent oxidoreductase [Clostridia bacterium]
MQTIEISKKVNVIGHYDVVVCGGGCAGFTAAISAARSGARTALIERYGFIGGTATAGYVVPISGFFFKGKRVVGGIAWELVEELEKRGAALVEYPKGHVSYNPEYYKPSTWGISNIYADDSEWQSVVSRMAQKSRLILMRVLDTDGCRWELLQCVNQYLDKTIFLLSGDSQIDFLKEILGKKYEILPNVSFLNNGCVALYIDKNTGKWNFVTIKSRKDVRLMLEHFAHNSSNLYEELCKKHERLSVLKNPFKKKKVSFRFYDIFNILIQPLWYIFYNKWPWFWKIVTGILLPICWLLIFNCSLFWQVFSAILFVFFSGYIAPKVSSAFDAWGSKQVCAMANKVLFHWIAVYCLFT